MKSALFSLFERLALRKIQSPTYEVFDVVLCYQYWQVDDNNAGPGLLNATFRTINGTK